MSKKSATASADARLKSPLDWPDDPIRLRLIRARAGLAAHKMSAKFNGDDRSYEAFSIHELATACNAELDKVGVDFDFTVEKWSTNGGFKLVEGWATFTCVERTGEEFDISDQKRVYVVGEGFNLSDKGFGMAVSYARKAGMVQGLNLAIGTDNEASNNRPEQPHQEAQPASGGPATHNGAPSMAQVFRFSFAGKPYDLIQPQIIGSITKYLGTATHPDQVRAWLDENADNLSALWKFSDRQGFAIRKMAESRIEELSQPQEPATQ